MYHIPIDGKFCQLSFQYHERDVKLFGIELLQFKTHKVKTAEIVRVSHKFGEGPT